MTENPIYRAAHVFQPDNLPKIDRGNGASTIPIVTAERGATSFLNGITKFEPGAAIGHHIHNVVESVMVIAGNAIVDIDGERTELSTFDTTLVPANIPHHFENASDAEGMAIFWTYASLDATRTLLESGNYGRIDAEHPKSSESASRNVSTYIELTADPGNGEALQRGIAEMAKAFQAAKGSLTMRLDRDVNNSGDFVLVLGWDGADEHPELWDSNTLELWKELVEPFLSSKAVQYTRQETATYF